MRSNVQKPDHTTTEHHPIMAIQSFALKLFISFSPGFSPVLKRDRKMVNRFNGLPGAAASTG